MEDLQADLYKIKAAFQAWHDTRRRSIDTWLALLADTVDFRSLASGSQPVSWTTSRSTRDQMRDCFSGLTVEFSMVHYAIERFVSEDDPIVVVGSTARHQRKRGGSSNAHSRRPAFREWEGGQRLRSIMTRPS
jgi:ketosteroid isomerase-like protein